MNAQMRCRSAAFRLLKVVGVTLPLLVQLPTCLSSPSDSHVCEIGVEACERAGHFTHRVAKA